LENSEKAAKKTGNFKIGVDQRFPNVLMTNTSLSFSKPQIPCPKMASIFKKTWHTELNRTGG
jgi:hypothetical protein